MDMSGFKHFRKLLLMLLASFLMAGMVPVEKQDKMSSHGCSSTIYPHMANFYKEKKNSLDTLVLGDSNVYRAFSPMIYWSHTHVASFSLATASQPAWLSYYVLKDALHYQKPNIVVFEINELFAKAQGKQARYCSTINTMRCPQARLQAIADQSGGFNDEDRDILYETFAKDIYKNTMQHILPSDETVSEKKDKPNYKGYLLNTTTLAFGGYKRYMSRRNMSLAVNEDNAAYIDKIIQLCKDHHITLLFVKFPTREWTTQKSDLAYDYAQKRNIPFLDMNRDMKNLDWSKDTKDAGFHMNDRGAEVCTEELIAFIKKHSRIVPCNDADVISSYEASLQRYEQERLKNITFDSK